VSVASSNALRCAAKADAFAAVGQKALARIYRNFAAGWARAAIQETP
jgi:hypothetical protein